MQQNLERKRWDPSTGRQLLLHVQQVTAWHDTGCPQHKSFRQLSHPEVVASGKGDQQSRQGSSLLPVLIGVSAGSLGAQILRYASSTSRGEGTIPQQRGTLAPLFKWEKICLEPWRYWYQGYLEKCVSLGCRPLHSQRLASGQSRQRAVVTVV